MQYLKSKKDYNINNMAPFFHILYRNAKTFRILITLLVLLIFSINKTNAAVEKELQEVRYAKALIAFNDKDYEKAIKYLGTNLNYKHVHLESIELLGQIHEKKKNFKKAIRVYYFLLKRADALKYIAIPYDKYFKDRLEDLPKPNAKQLSYLFKLGSLYISYHDQLLEKFEVDDNIQKIKNSKKKRAIKVKMKEGNKTKITVITQEEKRQALSLKIVQLAEKYLNICKENNFSLGLTNFMLGLAEKKKGNYHESSKLFKLAYQLSFDIDENEGQNVEQIKKKLDDGQKSLKEVLEFYIGDSLFKEGHRELATKYLKSLSSSTRTGSLRSFTRLYIDSLESSYLSISTVLGAGVDTNPSNQDPTTITNPEYGESDFYQNVEFNMFYNSNQKNNWAYTINGGYEQNTFFKSIYQASDTATYSFSSEIKYLQMPTGIWKLAFSMSNLHTKQDDSNAFSSFSSSVGATPSYDRYFKFGVISLSFPISTNSLTTTNGTAEYLETFTSITVTPWAISKLFQPSYSVTFGSTSTNGVISNSSNFRFSFTNQFSFSDDSTMFLSASLRLNTAETASESTQTIDASGQWLYSLNHWLENLMLQTKIDTSYTRVGETDPEIIKRHRISTNLQISF